MALLNVEVVSVLFGAGSRLAALELMWAISVRSFEPTVAIAIYFIPLSDAFLDPRRPCAPMLECAWRLWRMAATSRR